MRAIIRRLLKLDAAPEPVLAPPAPEPEPPRAPALREAAPVRRPSLTPDGDHTVTAKLEAALHRDLAARIAELRESEPPGDARALLDALDRPAGMIVRQPPAAAQRVLDVSRRPDAPLAELVALVERDPTLAQAVLRHASSAFYSMGGAPAQSLHDGVQRIGSRGLESVVLATIAEGMLCRPGPRFSYAMTEVWSHMARTAPLAQALAPAFGVREEQAFTLGLLHDVGKLLVFDRVAELRGELRRDVVIAPAAISRILVRLHEALGGLTLLRWGLGQGAAMAVATHHRDPVPGTPSPLGELLYVAERLDLAWHRCQPVELERWWAAGAIAGSIERAREAVAACERRRAVA